MKAARVPLWRQVTTPLTGVAIASILLLLSFDQAFAKAAKNRLAIVVAFPQLDSEGLAQTILTEMAASPEYRLLPVSALGPPLRQRDAEQALLEQADRLQDEGRQALLSLDLATAQDKLDAALELLQRSFVLFYAPARLAELHLVRGVMALRASRPDLARKEFVQARQLDDTLEPDAHYSPQVRSAYTRAVRALPPRPAPTPGQISAVIEQVPQAKLALVLTVQKPDVKHPVAQVLIFNPQEARYVTVESVPLPEQPKAAERTARRLGRRMGQQLARLVTPSNDEETLEKHATSQPVKHAAPARPWYKRWYVWVAVAAAVAVGAAVAIPLSAQRDVVDLEVNWRSNP